MRRHNASQQPPNTQAQAQAAKVQATARARTRAKLEKAFNHLLATTRQDPTFLVRSMKTQLNAVRAEEQKYPVAPKETAFETVAKEGMKWARKKFEDNTTDGDDSPFMGYDAEHLYLEYGATLPDDEPVIFHDRYYKEAEYVEDEDFMDPISLPEERIYEYFEENLARFWKAGINFGDN